MTILLGGSIYHCLRRGKTFPALDQRQRILCFNGSDCSVLWKQIVREHGPMLYRAAYRILHDEGEAEDVVQDVLLEAYRNHQENGKVPPGALLRRMATFRAIDRLRRRRRGQPIRDGTMVRFGQPPDRAMQEMEQVERLRQTISRLPQRQSQCFVLRYVEGMSCADIAQKLGMSLTSVSTALHKARTKLRASISGANKPE